MNYHRPAATEAAVKTSAVKSGGDYIVNGVKHGVANAPVAGLFAVLADIPGRGAGVLLVPADAPGVSVRAHDKAWHHGACGDVTFKDCKVPAGNLLGGEAAALLTGADAAGRGNPLVPGAQSRHRPRRLRSRARLRASARAGRPPDHRASGDRHQARRDRHPARGRAHRRSGRRPGPPIIPKPSPTAACPTCRCTTMAQVFTAEDAAEGDQGCGRSVRRHGRDARHAAAEIRARRAASACIRATATPTPSCASPKRWPATAAPATARWPRE